MKWDKKKINGQVASLVKAQVDKIAAAAQQEKSDLSEVASILSSMNGNNGGAKPSGNAAQNDDRAMAAAVNINKIIQRKRDNP